MSASPVAAPNRAVLLAGIAIPIAVAVWVYWPATGTYFAADDITFLSRAAGLSPAPAGEPRWLSNRLAWSALHAVFGLDPRPYHVVLLALHLIATTLVFGLGQRLYRSTALATACAALFAVSMPAFTPLHWVSAIGDLLCAVAGLAALWWATGEGAERWRPWVVAGCCALAIAAKETGVMLVLPLLVAVWPTSASSWSAGVRGALRALAPALGVAIVGAVGVGAALVTGAHLGGPAYALDGSPLALLARLVGYVRWAIPATDSIPDRVALLGTHLDAVQWTLGVLLVGLALAWVRGGDRGMRLGAVWFVGLLLPVLPLGQHAYLYYVYVPWAGAALLLGGLAAQVWRRWPQPVVGALGVLALVAEVLLVQHHTRARAQAQEFDLPLDRTVRESTILANALAGLAEAGVQAPDTLAFVSAFPVLHADLAGGGRSPSAVQSYVPLAAALREGETLALLRPGIVVRGFADRIRADWPSVRWLTYLNDGRLRALGRGAAARAQLGALQLESERWPEAEANLRAAIALGDHSADTAYALLHAVAGQGRSDEATRLVEEFVRLWPRDPRTPTLREALASGAR